MNGADQNYYLNSKKGCNLTEKCLNYKYFEVNYN